MTEKDKLLSHCHLGPHERKCFKSKPETFEIKNKQNELGMPLSVNVAAFGYLEAGICI